MRIESFHIQGFKSLADVKVEGLSDINVFYGLNNVGKSNIFEALALWSRCLTASERISQERFETEFGSSIFRLDDGQAKNTIQVSVSFMLDQKDEVSQQLRHESIGPPKSSIQSQQKTTVQSHLKLLFRNNTPEFQWENSVIRNSETIRLPDSIGSKIFQGLHRIDASRRFQIERQSTGQNLDSISDHNLKQALFYAYLSRDLQQKHRLEAIKRLLAAPPFNLGELDIALDPTTDQIDIGFVRPDGRLPLENMGSGVQQLLLVLGQIFLNDYPIVAIEEPEMNLSPQYQQYLLVALRELMKDPNVKLNQLFISTHSPYFEFAETFFDVTMDENGATQVVKLPIEARDRYFPNTPIGEETGSRLNSLNQITLYNGVLEDLGLQRGDLVLFTKNEAGHWELRPEQEITQELETVFNDNDA